jgi:hypothetical protein
MDDQNSKSRDILYNSATLLGLCFIVLTSVKLTDRAETSKIDELTAVSIIMFMACCVLSYLSMRGNSARDRRYEKIADFVFLIGLLFLFLTTILLLTNIIR